MLRIFSSMGNISVDVLLWFLICIELVLIAYLIRSLVRIKSSVKEKMASIRKDQAEIFHNTKHELKTPVSVILGQIELIKNNSSKENLTHLKTYIKSIENNADYLNDLLNSLTNWYAIDIEKFPADIESVNIAKLMEETIEWVQAKEMGHSNRIVMTFTGEIPIEISLQKKMYVQCVVNLIRNSIKFSQNSTVNIDISLSKDESGKGGVLIFLIKDSGIGISDESLEKVFKPFYKYESTMSRSYSGLGLGLTVCKKLVDEMGGEIKFQSGVKLGAECTMKIPVKTVSKEIIEVGDGSKEIEFKEIQSIELEKTLEKKLKILIVDDAKEIRFLYKKIIEDLDVIALYAENGREALNIIKYHDEMGEPIQLVLMDLQMPILSGYQATRLLRQQGFALPVVAVTAHEMSGDKKIMLEYGFSEVLQKPINRDMIKKQIQRYAL